MNATQEVLAAMSGYILNRRLSGATFSEIARECDLSRVEVAAAYYIATH